MQPTIQSVVDSIRGLSLLDADQLAQRVDRIGNAAPETLLDILVQEGLLTLFQAEMILSGNAHKLALGNYRLMEPIGEGGMGRVYKASQVRLNRKVALKVISSHMADDPHAIKRFQREALAAAALNHPNIVTIYDFDCDGDIWFLAMEYVEGVDLSKTVKARGPLGIRESCIYIRQAAIGLQHAHDAGLIHRDIKPHNLLLTYPHEQFKHRSGGIGNSARLRTANTPSLSREPESAVVKILDMGLARFDTIETDVSSTALTKSQSLLGTPDFIAPEQARDARNVDGRADIYSLGCTLYYLLAGQVPFPEGTGIEKLIAHQSGTPEPIENIRPQVPSAVANVVRRMMAKRPEQRYSHPVEIVAALDEALRGGAPLPSVVDIALPTLPDQPPAPRPPLRPPAFASNTKSVEGTRETPVTFSTSTETQLKTDTAEHAAASVYEGTVDQIRARIILEWTAHRGMISTLAFTPDGASIASCGIDESVRVWDCAASPPKEQAAGGGQRLSMVQSMAFAPTYPQVALGSAEPNGAVMIWNWDQTKGNNLTVLTTESAIVHSLAYAPDDGGLLAAAVGPNVWVWRAKSADVKIRATFKGHRLPVKVVAISPRESLIASGCDEGAVRIWQVGRLWAGEKAVVADHGGTVMALAWSPDGNHLASVAEDQTVRIWQVMPQPAARSVNIGQMDGLVRRMAWTVDGRGLFVVNAGGHVVLWEVGTKSRKVREWQLESGVIVGASLLSEGFLAVGGSEGVIRVFQLHTPWASA